MLSDKKARHFHAGKLRKVIGDTLYVSVTESDDLVYVADNGTFTSASRGWQITKGNLEKDGYRRIDIGGRHAVTARVVYEVFVEQIPDGMEIDHINTVRDDNRVENLRVVTRSENLLNPLTRPRRRIACAKNGAKGAAAQPRAVLLSNLAKGSKARKLPVVATCDGQSVVYPSATDAAKALGLSQQAICHALKKRVRTCGGMVWAYCPEGGSNG